VKKRFSLGLILLFILAGGCQEIIEEPVLPNHDGDPVIKEETIELMKPEMDGSMPLEKAINQRVSRRNFKDTPLGKDKVSQLLWSAGSKGVDAITGPTRVAPSAGATHPMELHLVAGRVEGLDAGTYRYLFEDHSLERVGEEDVRKELAEAALGQEFIAEAPVSIVVAAHYEKTTGRYGERGKRYVHMEAGNISQNIYLQAEALNLGTVAIGAFHDNEVAALLKEGGTPLMIMPAGEVF